MAERSSWVEKAALVLRPARHVTKLFCANMLSVDYENYVACCHVGHALSAGCTGYAIVGKLPKHRKIIEKSITSIVT